MITYKRADLDDELRQILEIQKRNMKSSLTDSEKKAEGFLTVGYDFNILKKMNNACAHIIAKKGSQVVGYALVMLRNFKNELPLLTPMFVGADDLLGNKNYVAMGQICIDKPFRKKGIFKGLYGFYRKELEGQYDCLFTEVATDNKHSLEAHKKVGFIVLKTQISDGISWELVNWDWK